MTRWLPIPLALLSGLLGILWGMDRTRFDARARELEASRDASVAALEASRARNDSVDAANAALLSQLDSVRRAATQRRAAAVTEEARAVVAAAAAGATLDSTLDSIEISMPQVWDNYPLVDSARVQVAIERAAHFSVAEALRVQVHTAALELAAADSTIVLLEERISARDQLVGSLKLALSEERELREHFEREARPSFLRGLWQDLPRLAAYAGAGFVVGVVVR